MSEHKGDSEIFYKLYPSNPPTRHVVHFAGTEISLGICYITLPEKLGYLRASFQTRIRFDVIETQFKKVTNLNKCSEMMWERASYPQRFDERWTYQLQRLLHVEKANYALFSKENRSAFYAHFIKPWLVVWMEWSSNAEFHDGVGLSFRPCFTHLL